MSHSVCAEHAQPHCTVHTLPTAICLHTGSRLPFRSANMPHGECSPHLRTFTMLVPVQAPYTLMATTLTRTTP